MFKNFNFLNYFKTNHKLRKLRELINRIYGHYLFKLDKINKLENSIDRLEMIVDQLETVIEGLLPDLIILSITPTYYTNYINFEITVKNIGTEEAPITSTNVIIENINININIPILAIDETFIFNVQFAFDPSGEDKNYTVITTADSNNTVEELDETNNIKRLNFIAKEEYEPPAEKSYIIVNCHNPEGKEINSITGVVITAEIFVDSISKGSGAINEATHGIPIEIEPGNKLIEVKFNGMTESQNINIAEGQTKQLTFIFNRIEFDLESEWRNRHTCEFVEFFTDAIPDMEGNFNLWYWQYKGTSIFSDGFWWSLGLDTQPPSNPYLWFGGIASGTPPFSTFKHQKVATSYPFWKFRMDITGNDCLVYNAGWDMKFSSVPYDMDGSAV